MSVDCSVVKNDGDAINCEHTQYFQTLPLSQLTITQNEAFETLRARAEIVKKTISFKAGHARTNSRSIDFEVTDAKLTATALLEKGLSKIHKPPFKDFSQEVQDDVK